MKLGLISDIHGDPLALELAWSHLTVMGADRIVCAGDLVGYGPYPDRVVAFLEERQVASVRGNHDRWALERGLGVPDEYGGGPPAPPRFGLWPPSPRTCSWPTSIRLASSSTAHHEATWSSSSDEPIPQPPFAPISGRSMPTFLWSVIRMNQCGFVAIAAWWSIRAQSYRCRW